MYVCVCVFMYVCMYLYMYVCEYVCMYVCMTACMYVCMYVCKYVCMYAYIHTYVRAICHFTNTSKTQDLGFGYTGEFKEKIIRNIPIKCTIRQHNHMHC